MLQIIPYFPLEPRLSLLLGFTKLFFTKIASGRLSSFTSGMPNKSELSFLLGSAAGKAHSATVPVMPLELDAERKYMVLDQKWVEGLVDTWMMVMT